MNRLRFAWSDMRTDDDRLAEAAKALATDLADATPFTTWEWLKAAAAHSRRRVIFLEICRGCDLVGLIPLTVGIERWHGLPLRSLRLLGDPLADRVPLLLGDERLFEEVLDALFAAPVAWDVALLAEIPATDQLRARGSEWGEGRRRRVAWRLSSRAPVLAFDSHDVASFPLSYSRSLRTRLRRARKRLDEAGTARFERQLPSAAELRPLLDKMKAVEDASWKGAQGVGIFSTPQRRRFFADVAHAFAGRGWLDLAFLHLDETLISYRFGFRFRNVFYDYNLAFLPRFAALSPGRILIDEIIRSSVAAGLAAVDSSRASLATGHLLAEWTPRFVEHYELRIFNRTMPSWLCRTALDTVRPLLRREAATAAANEATHVE